MTERGLLSADRNCEADEEQKPEGDLEGAPKKVLHGIRV